MTWDGLCYIWEQKGVIGGGYVSQDLAFYGVYLDKKSLGFSRDGQIASEPRACLLKERVLCEASAWS